MDTSHPPTQYKSSSQPGFWKGVVVGLAVVLAGLAIVVAVMFFAMGRCPMCGGMM